MVKPTGIVDVQDGGYLRPRQNGSATLVASVGGKQASVPVAVKGMEMPAPVSFRHDVIATLNVGGCNAGACHGTPSGKNGFKLSLRGFDPPADFLQLTRDQFGRRTGKHDAEQSLVFMKAVGRVPHEGGQRFGATSLPGEMLSALARATVSRTIPHACADHEGRSAAGLARAEVARASGSNWRWWHRSPMA